jgi:Flp pilus assembly protein TadG
MLPYGAFLIDNTGRLTMKRLSDLRGQAMALLPGYCRATAPGRAGAQFRTGGRLRAFLRSSCEGQSIVETAFLVPIMLALIMGIYAVGIIAFNDVALNNAVDIGASSLMKAGYASNTNMNVASDYSTDVAPLTDPCKYAFAQMTTPTSNLIPGNITVTYILTFVSSGNTVTDTIGPFTGPYTAGSTGGNPNTCTSYSADFAIGGSLTIVATYPCTLGLYGFNVPGCKLTAKASQFIYTS